MSNQMQTTMQKIPGIGDIPILGYMFKSKASKRDQTELVVMITPEILPNNSPGVTPSLPMYPDTFMPPLSDLKKSYPAPAPAFTGVAVAGGESGAPVADNRTEVDAHRIGHSQRSQSEPRQPRPPCRRAAVAAAPAAASRRGSAHYSGLSRPGAGQAAASGGLEQADAVSPGVEGTAPAREDRTRAG
jgi:hypothetical protein